MEQQRLQLKKEVESLAFYFDLIQDIHRMQSPELYFWLSQIRKAVAEVNKHLVVITGTRSDSLDDAAREFHIHQLHYGQQKIVEIYNDMESSAEIFTPEQRQRVLKIIADLSNAIEQLIPA